jgi:hypothetical protein
MAINPDKPRWRRAYPYLKTLPIREKRRFYAQAVKFFLDELRWDEALRNPSNDDHANSRDMLNAFNTATRSAMSSRASYDIKCQFELVQSIKLGKKRRVRKKQISRLTYEIMQLIRAEHPIGHSNRRAERNRVKGMSRFQREFKQKYFGK